ncbi:MAG: hypothetical protein K2Q10_12660, partial [Rhodospirillales bacterium]|nr:hypothetical protein [Rhodospirillales bacterium]
MESSETALLLRSAAAAEQIFLQDNLALQIEAMRYWHQEIAQPRYQEPKRLLKFGYKMYSQSDEDGLIAEIFRRIGYASRRFI